MLGARRSQVKAYILDHLHPTTPDGQPWGVRVTALSTAPDSTGQDLVATLLMTPPPSVSVRRLDLRYDVIVWEIVTHSALVSVRSDWRSGVGAGDAQLLGGIGGQTQHLAIDWSAGSAWRGFCNIFHLGMSHIAEGTDHLLFLLTLLLPAPLLVVGSRWSGLGVRCAAACRWRGS